MDCGDGVDCACCDAVCDGDGDDDDDEDEDDCFLILALIAACTAVAVDVDDDCGLDGRGMVFANSSDVDHCNWVDSS